MNKERFEKKFIPVTESGCWIWICALGSKGYGAVADGVNTKRAHRVSWEIYKGKIPDGVNVLHKCDVPSCVNPDHLFLGTQRDNMADRGSKGRSACGESIQNSKLNESSVIEIRQSSESQTYLAAKYGVSQTSISQVQLRKSWKHVL